MKTVLDGIARDQILFPSKIDFRSTKVVFKVPKLYEKMFCNKLPSLYSFYHLNVRKVNTINQYSRSVPSKIAIFEHNTFDFDFFCVYC